jgi:riboflavin synthase
MFTGIIQGQGRLKEIRKTGKAMIFSIEAGFELTDPVEGESIAINGVCLTAREISGRNFLADVSPESIARTTLAQLGTGQMVNLERALQLSDRLGGHIVAGHVDSTVSCLNRQSVGDFVLFSFAIPQGMGRYFIEKGSVAIDGISLTVNACDDKKFSVSIIPHTLKETTLEKLKPGISVNIEVDLIGKYVEKMVNYSKYEISEPPKSKITASFLAEHGF